MKNSNSAPSANPQLDRRSTFYRYNNYEYRWDDGNHELLDKKTGNVYNLKYTFEKNYFPTYKEVMDVIDDWRNWSSTTSKRSS